MASGAIDLSVMDFGKLISTTMRGQFFGSKEVVYQAYVIETSRYRTVAKDHVTELREFGLAFLGPYCAVVGRLLERDRGDNWKVHSADKDEARRAEMYKAVPGC